MHPEPPWIVRRDELHVLEDAFDELCRRRPDGPALEGEEAVLREHADTEDKTEAELTAAIGDAWMDAPEGCGHDHDHDHASAPAGTLLDRMRRDLTRDPAYERAITWAGDTYRWAREREADRRPDLLRASLNACLVPMKMSYAHGELSSEEDPYASAVADKELELAAVYLSRARGSLEALKKAGVLEDGFFTLIERTERIAADIADARKLLGGFRPFDPSV